MQSPWTGIRHLSKPGSRLFYRFMLFISPQPSWIQTTRYMKSSTINWSRNYFEVHENPVSVRIKSHSFLTVISFLENPHLSYQSGLKYHFSCIMFPKPTTSPYSFSIYSQCLIYVSLLFSYENALIYYISIVPLNSELPSGTLSSILACCLSIRIVQDIFNSPGWCGSVDWAPDCEAKGR